VKFQGSDTSAYETLTSMVTKTKQNYRKLQDQDIFHSKLPIWHKINIIYGQQNYTVVHKKTRHFYFFANSGKYCRIFV